MKKQIILSALGAMLLASCADTWDKTYTGEDNTKPEYAYLKGYKPLKENLDRTANPGYKVGGALTASEFNEGKLVYSLAKTNFDEIVAGNAMKMASCVNDKGAMDFGTVSTFVNTAEEAGLTVYGHTLAWHAQQPAKYLNSLLEDKKLDIDPDAKFEVEDYHVDCKNIAALDWNGCPADVAITMGGADGITFQNAAPIDPWYAFQYWLVKGINAKAGQEYYVRAEIRNDGSMPLSLNFKLGDWGGGFERKINVDPTGQVETVEFKVIPTMDSSGIFLQNNEGWVGSYTLKSFTVYHLESPAVEIETEIKNFTYLETYGSDAPFPFYQMGSAPPIVNGAIHFVPTGEWSQFFIDNAMALPKGDYKLILNIKGSEETSIHLTAQNGWGSDAQQINVNVPISTEFKEVALKLNEVEGGNYDFILKPETNPATIDLLGYRVVKVEKGNSIPLTPEEKKEILTGVMNTWCAGMMNATGAKVKAWDLINEAISGGGNVKGYYDLQHSYEGQAASDFFWQDYLGSEDYGVIVEKAAREAFEAAGGNPSDLKLFINDYNLESDWDTNKKLKSLIYWIGVWESRGAKIDGIGSQMHISYYENPTTLENKKAAIVNMYKLMAETGKLVRVSEFDMGYVDANGNDVATADLTEAQHKAMAEYWNWNIRAYMDNVPAPQRYGFTNWCITDSPAGSGWRANSPVGLWDLNYNRKHTYAGYANGLQGKDY